jgi:hypothetical protein
LISNSAHITLTSADAVVFESGDFFCIEMKENWSKYFHPGNSKILAQNGGKWSKNFFFTQMIEIIYKSPVPRTKSSSSVLRSLHFCCAK